MKKIILVCLLILAFTCSDDENESQSDSIALNLVTGLDIRADEFSSPIRLGNPNVLVEQTVVFPNPAPSVLSIQTLSSDLISDVWILKGNVERSFEDTDFEDLLTSNLYTEDELNNNSEDGYVNINSSNIIINLNEFEEGYYRVFIKVNEIIEWHNIYIGAPEINSLIDFWN